MTYDIKGQSDSKDVIKTISYKGKEYKLPVGLFINNEFVPGKQGKMFATVNPVTAETIVTVHEATAADVDVAVQAAKAALPDWQKMSSSARGYLLYKLADLIERDIQELAEIESLDNGKTVLEATHADLALVLGCYRYYAGWSDKIHGKVMEIEPSLHSYTRHEAVGVVGQIIPWNFPLLMQAWKLGPALACGNVVVMKTSEKTPLSGLKLASLIVEAGFPPGVVNILSGYGPSAGDPIARHMEIQKVAFTGSTGVGRLIMKAAADSNLKKVSLELGGKSPNIVFDDANVDVAVQAATTGIFLNHGQCCCAGSRIFVQEGVYDKFVTKMTELTKGLKVGDGFEAGVQHGPLVDSIQFDRVMGYIKSGKEHGATVLVGGTRVGDKGYFVAPTLFSDVHDSMPIAQEEIFGPVAVIIKFKTIEEVVKRANSTNYGLAAAIHTKDLSTALKMTTLLHAGTVWVNTYNVLTASMPFGGFKESGIGRELGKYAIREYTEIKSIIINMNA